MRIKDRNKRINIVRYFSRKKILGIKLSINVVQRALCDILVSRLREISEHFANFVL